MKIGRGNIAIALYGFLMNLLPLLPIFVILFLVYRSYMPLGYQASYQLLVGGSNDTGGSLSLEPSKFLSSPKSNYSGSYRELNGLAYAVFRPQTIVKGAEIDVSVEGDNLTIDGPFVDMDPNNYVWDYFWNLNKKIPEEMTGGAYVFDGSAEFDGKSSLLVSDTEDQFESGPFSVYAKWKPRNQKDDYQEIVGHYNWEVFQDGDKVRFMVGRMNEADGPFREVSVPVGPDFFLSWHELVASYAPGDSGKIELIVDGSSYQQEIGRDKILADYNQGHPLSLGMSRHTNAKYFTGAIAKVAIATKNMNFVRLPSDKHIRRKTFTMPSGSDQLKIPIYGQGKLYKVDVTVKKPSEIF